MQSVNANLTQYFNRLIVLAAAPCALALAGGAAHAQQTVPIEASPAERATYADLVDLSERSDLVIRAQIRRQITVKPERAPGLAPGFARLYIEARTLGLIAGTKPVGESLAYLVDVPLNAKGKPDKLKDREVILFADVVEGRPSSIQLTGRHAQLDYSPAFEARLRPVLTSLVSGERPPKVTGIRDALAVEGTLAGESETQIFLETGSRSPVSVTVLRRPGQRPVWGVSWGEIIDSSASAPRPETLRWYRLACALPARLPSSANLAREPAARRLAEADYAFVVQQLGPCERAITEAS